MPTNVTAEYKKTEAAFRQAREPRERLDCLREMLRTIPKHKVLICTQIYTSICIEYYTAVK